MYKNFINENYVILSHQIKEPDNDVIKIIEMINHIYMTS